MAQTYGLLGVPSSAGAHWPGQERAPAALRATGLVERLSAAGRALVDYGDLPVVRCRVDRTTNPAQTRALVQTVAQQLAIQIAPIVRAQHIPLVIGGDCTITLGLLAGMVQVQPDLALLYLDGGTDTATPATYRLGMLDSMGVAHLIGEPGADETLSHIGPRYPLMAGTHIIPFGYLRGEPAAREDALLARHDIRGYPIDHVRGRTEDAARDARARLEHLAKQFVIHFDVDVIDFVDFPAADVLQPGQGLSFADTFTALRVVCASPQFAGLVVTEFNPDHDDAEGTLAMQLTNSLATVLTP